MFDEIPLVSDKINRLDMNEIRAALTRDMCGRLELGKHLRIYRDHDFLLLIHDSIPLLDLISHPISEWLSDHGSTDIDNPLFRDLGQVWLVREVEPNILMSANKLQYFLDRQVFVLRNMYVFEFIHPCHGATSQNLMRIFIVLERHHFTSISKH